MAVQSTEFRKEVKKRLIDMDQTAEWLCQRVHESTGLYFDSSYLSRILNGKLPAPHLVAAIREILDLPEEAAQ